MVGVLAQRSRLCMVGGIRDAVMFKDFRLISAFIAIIVAVLVGNLILGNFVLGFEGQPVAHSDGLWNLLGMVLVLSLIHIYWNMACATAGGLGKEVAPLSR